MPEIIFKTDGEGFLTRIYQMIENVIHQGHGSVALVFLIGVMFGGIIQLSNTQELINLKRLQVLRC